MLNISFTTPTVVYSLNKQISNFKSFASDLNIEETKSYPESLPCHCENSPYLDKDQGRILTGNLQIVGNKELRKIENVV